jgi:rhodanese-related sulfurtransferase
VSEIEITPEMTMEQILQRAPAAQRALFQRYHVGGCSACGFQPSDTLAQVCKDHNILDVNEVIGTIRRAEELDGKVQIEPAQVRSWLDAGEEFSFIDVRTPDELEQARIAEAEPLDYTNQARYMELPKDRRIVFTCHTGERSLDVASYFIGHGYSSVFSMRGGIQAWSREIDPSVPQY